jgi:ribose 1,5-bisphosphate isomerase
MGTNTMNSITQRIDALRNDREHGSRWLVREAIAILYDLASDTSLPEDQSMQQLRDAGRQLVQARPAMAAISGAVARILSAADGGPTAVARKAQQVRDHYDHSIEHIIHYARPVLTGTLMTDSISGTVLEVFAACAQQIDQVIVLEGRPRFEGRATASTLAGKGMRVTLITDAQADIFLPQCQAVVVGADAVLINGDVLNKAGTALLGWAAQGHHIPFYVLCETLKISSQQWSGDLAMLEEKEPEEVLDTPISGVTARNFYFDRTPATLVTKIITEEGMMGGAEIQQIASLLQPLMRNL